MLHVYRQNNDTALLQWDNDNKTYIITGTPGNYTFQPYENYTACISNARLVKRFDGMDTLKECIEYVKKYF